MFKQHSWLLVIALVCTWLLASAAQVKLVQDYRRNSENGGYYRPTANCPNPDERTFDGTCNNLNNKNWGATDSFFSRVDGVKFQDGISIPIPSPNERRVSNAVFAQRPYSKRSLQYGYYDRKFGLSPDPLSRSHLFVIFGQLVTHDLASNKVGFTRNLEKTCAIQILDTDDPLYDAVSVVPNITFGYPRNRGLSFESFGVIDNGTFVGINTVSHYLDGGVFYGSTKTVADRLRLMQGGKLNLTEAQQLPQARALGVPNQCATFDPIGSAAGDTRSDENPVLQSLHVLFAREHNRLASVFAARNPTWTDEQIYQEARKWNIAQYQHLIFDEYLPLLVGKEIFDQYIGEFDRYDDTVDATLVNSFALAGIRVQHDQVNFPLLSISNSSTCSYVPSPGTLPGYEIQERANCLKTFTEENGIEAFLRGSMIQFAQSFDGVIADDMRNIHSKADTAFCNLDVEAVNVMRATQHGVLPWSDLVKYWTGLDLYTLPGCTPGTEEDPIRCFHYVTNNVTLAQTLQSLYKKIDKLNAFVGFVTESTKTSSDMGRTAAIVTAKSFNKLRNGDRWWYENHRNGLFTPREVREIKSVKLSDIIKRNTNLQVVPEDAFYARQRNARVDNDVILCDSVVATA